MKSSSALLLAFATHVGCAMVGSQELAASGDIPEKLSLYCEWTQSFTLETWPVEQMTPDSVGTTQTRELSESTVFEFANQGRGSVLVERNWVNGSVAYLPHFAAEEISGIASEGSGRQFQVLGKTGVMIPAQLVTLSISRVTGSAKKKIFFPEDPEPNVALLLVEQFGTCRENKKKF
jgi:hypothetical protein